MPGAVFGGIDENSFDPKGQGLSNEYDLPMSGWLAWLFSERSNSLLKNLLCPEKKTGGPVSTYRASLLERDNG